MNKASKQIKGLEQGKIKKAIYGAAAQAPATVYSITGASLAGLYGLAFGFNPVIMTLAGAGLLASISSGLFEALVRGDKHANSYVESFRKGLEKRRDQSLKALKVKLEKINHRAGLKQVELFRAKYDNFVGILDQKLAPGELTYNRYLTIAEQVFLGGLDNLESAALAIDSVSAIDEEHIDDEIMHIEHKQEKSEFDISRVQQLQTRKSLQTAQLQKAESLLHANEYALTQLDYVTTKIANINTQQGRSQIALDEAMSELKHLIDRADGYSN